MRETPMHAGRRKAMGRGDQMGRNFLKALDAGALLDRTTARGDGKKCKRVALPAGLKGMAKRGGGHEDSTEAGSFAGGGC